MIRIMGLDLAMGTTGVCFPDGTTRTIRPKGKGDDRLNEIRGVIELTLDHVDLAILEDVPSNMKGAAGKVIPMLHGSVRSALMDYRVPYVVVSPSTLKKYATGRGNCDKAAMILAAYKRGRVEFTDDNECDAWWLHAAGTERAERPLFVLPLPQRQALGVVDWSPLERATAAVRGRQRAVSPVPVLDDPFA